MNKKLTIGLVTYNGKKYFPDLLGSLNKQMFKDFKLVVLDNTSNADDVKVLEEELSKVDFKWELIKQTENIGFAGGHNQIFKSCSSEYYMLLNPDMFLLPDAVQKIIDFLDKNKNYQAVAPRLMKWDFENNKLKTDYIDTLGLKVYKNRRVVEIGEWEDWKVKKQEIKDTALPVFGLDGASAVFRVEDVKNILVDDQLLCGFFKSYKEDVDLAFRMQSSGLKVCTVLDAVIYHDRTGKGSKKKGVLADLENKREQSDYIKYNSYKNQLMVLYSNERWQNFLLDFLFIFCYELKKFFYYLFFDRKVLKGLFEIWEYRKELKSRRKQIKKLRKVGYKKLRKFF